MSSGPANSQGCFCGQRLNLAFSLVTKENCLAGLPRWELPPGPSWDPTFLSPGAAQPRGGVHLQAPMRTPLYLRLDPAPLGL